MTEWGFYGRKEELKEVAADLQWTKFSALTIRGRRGIGKTTLLAEAGRKADGDPPVLMFELQPPSEESLEAARERLLRTVRSELGPSILEGLPPPHPMLHSDNFCDVVNHLLFRNVAVCLDEFHHAEGLGLTSAIKRLVDASGPLRRPRPTGTLFIMGSHQQRFEALFRSDQPLFQRFSTSVVLRQWRVPTVLGMAEEHGFLRNPGRFLTLWTAFGGIPRNWEAFASSDRNAGRLRDFAPWPDDGSWRLAFLDWQRLQLKDNPEERFDDRSHIELAEPHREVLLWLALNEPRGAMVRDFPAGLRHADRDPPLRKSLDVLSSQLELIEQTAEFYGGDESRWSVADNNTLFQISVFPELFGSGPVRGRALDVGESGTLGRPVGRLETLEGLALERLAADWLGGLPGMVNSLQGVWRHRRNPPAAHPDGTPLPPLVDIDVLGAHGYLSDPDASLFVGGCKRNPRKHNPAEVDRQADELLADLGRGEGADSIRSMRRQQFLVSPEFKAEHRRRFGESGHVCIDVPGMRLMARELESSPDMDPMKLMLLADRRQLHMEEAYGPGEGEPGPAEGTDHDGASSPGM